MKLLVSACLLGCACRYDGKSQENEKVLSLLKAHTLIPVCPEQLGGLCTPRVSAERVGKRVMTRDGRDVTAQYMRGALEALRLYQRLGCEAAVLKARSPSCGSREIYDGTFTGTRVTGEGVCVQLLRENGVRVLDEEHLDEL